MSTSKSRQLAEYLTGAVGIATLISAQQAEASVTSFTFGFGPVLTASSSLYTAESAGYGTLFTYTNGFPRMRLGGFTAGQGQVYQTSSHTANEGFPSFLSYGTLLGAGGNGTLGMAWFASEKNADENFTSNQNGNIGFKTSTGNWGWANVSYDATAKALTVNSAYVESVSGTPITVGDTGISAAPEPSRALLALAGLAAVGLRRRRKQVA